MYPKPIQASLIGLIISLFFLNTTFVFAKSDSISECESLSRSISSGGTQSYTFEINDKQ